jgi:hypothetical protein
MLLRLCFYIFLFALCCVTNASADVPHKLMQFSCVEEVGLFRFQSFRGENLSDGLSESAAQKIKNEGLGGVRYGVLPVRCESASRVIEIRSSNRRDSSPRGMCGMQGSQGADVIANGAKLFEISELNGGCLADKEHEIFADQYRIRHCVSEMPSRDVQNTPGSHDVSQKCAWYDWPETADVN